MKKIAIIASLIGALVMGVGVWAQMPGGKGGGFGGQIRERISQRFGQRFGQHIGGGRGEAGGMMAEGMMFKHILGDLELAKKAGVSDEQIKKLKEGQFDFEKQMITLRADAETSKLDVKKLMESDKPDRDAVSKAIDVAGAKELALRKAGIMRMLDVKETLGKDTIEKIKGLAREQMQQHTPQSQSGAPGMMMRPWMNRGGQMPGQHGGFGGHGATPGAPQAPAQPGT